MELKVVLHTLKNISQEIKSLQDFYGSLPDEIDFNEQNHDEKYKASMCRKILSELHYIKWDIDWMEKPIIYEGILVKNEYGKYEIEGTDYVFSSGAPLDYWDDSEGWETSRIEHNGEDYYIVGLGKEKEISGVKVRKK